MTVCAKKKDPIREADGGVPPAFLTTLVLHTQ